MVKKFWKIIAPYIAPENLGRLSNLSKVLSKEMPL